MRANIPKGMGGGPQNMQSMIRQAQKMQEDMAAKQEELDAREYEINAGGGVVTVKINGNVLVDNVVVARVVGAEGDVNNGINVIVKEYHTVGINDSLHKFDEINVCRNVNILAADGCGVLCV